MNFAPIVLFAFNRPKALEKSLAALSANQGASESELYIFIDGPRSEEERGKVDEVFAIAKNADGFREVSVMRSATNRGLGPSVIDGVTGVISRYGRVIVLEDDLVTAPDFIMWMNTGLERYAEEDTVFSVCGYTNKINVPMDYGYDGFFAPRSSSWGWATWKERWESVDWNPTPEDIHRNARAFNKWGGSDCGKMLKDWRKGLNKSWAIRFCYSEFLQKKVSLFPVFSHVDPSDGFDGAGTNCKRYSRFRWIMDSGSIREYQLPENTDVIAAFRKSSLRYHSILIRVWSRIMYLVHG